MRDGEIDGHHNLICQCNGARFEGKEDLVAFIAHAPVWLQLLVERVRKLEKVASIIKDNPFTFSSWLDKQLAVELSIAMLELEGKEST